MPFDPKLIDLEALDPAERAWLEEYQRNCVRRLEPHLPAEELAELRRLLA